MVRPFKMAEPFVFQIAAAVPLWVIAALWRDWTAASSLPGQIAATMSNSSEAYTLLSGELINKHGARSTKQAIAIGLSKARRAGVDLKPPKKGRASARTRKSAERDYDRGHSHKKKSISSASRRSRSRLAALKREPHSAASHTALSRQ